MNNDLENEDEQPVVPDPDEEVCGGFIKEIETHKDDEGGEMSPIPMEFGDVGEHLDPSAGGLR